MPALFRKLVLAAMFSLLWAGQVAPTRADDLETPEAVYLKAMCHIFHEDGKLMAHVIIDVTDPFFGSQEKVQQAAKYITERLSSVTPPDNFKDAHQKLVQVFNTVGVNAGVVVSIMPAQQVLGFSARDMYPIWASQAFQDFHNSVNKALANGLGPQYDPWLAAAKEPNGQPNSDDSSDKFGLSGPLEVSIQLAPEKDKLMFGGFFDAVGVKQKGLK
jgi:hypothetical protein